ncbi:putative bifunctional diguanylate cyclase/phosphodiesterase [Thiocystis violacea]|uniref:putative bifunctional diguanylate cyclase/phosphodiesterase n=1 Tax=Thiocystis violacea TaxID=13725 RepID=UPI0019037D12|nr:bifunctional diguanylate cyclase/phosphodiesterase [Thiocystis violacea]MBK1718963.1 GGDEF-domain containing protein [Thiocystis violacea]
MNPVPHPRLMAPAESPGDLSPGSSACFHPLALNVLRAAMARVPLCRTLSELFGVLDQSSRLLLPEARIGILLRQPDACFELVHCLPVDSESWLRELTERLIEQGRFAQALKQGASWWLTQLDETALLLRIATANRIYGVAIWVDQRIPNHLQEALGALADLAGLTLDRLQGGAESFLVPSHSDPDEANGARLGEDIAIPADQLTGLAHRAHFMRFLQQAILGRTPRLAVATLLLDIDGFHRVNRELGCETGDQVLREVALRLDGALRSQLVQDTIGIAEHDICFARTGADEFGIALARVRDPRRLAELAHHLHSHIAEGFLQHGSRLYLSVSIGLASSEGLLEATSAEVMLRNADSALKRAKITGRNKHVLYEPGWAELGSTHLRTESLLQEALRKDSFTLHFQPLFHLADRRLAGAEVLLRLTLGDGTPLPPSSFIPVAESTGQIVEIGEWVMRRTCRQIRSWDALGFPRIPLAINVSAIELSQTDLGARFRAILEQESVPVERLHLEITETAIARNEEQALANIRSLRTVGFEVWIDDFGTGYSSLKSIKNYPASGIKLDREFVKDLAEQSSADVIAGCILSMAGHLGYPVVAEGIENPEQYEFLRRNGCDIGQGFHLGRPVDRETFQALYLVDGADRSSGAPLPAEPPRPGAL